MVVCLIGQFFHRQKEVEVEIHEGFTIIQAVLNDLLFHGYHLINSVVF